MKITDLMTPPFSSSSLFSISLPLTPMTNTNPATSLPNAPLDNMSPTINTTTNTNESPFPLPLASLNPLKMTTRLRMSPNMTALAVMNVLLLIDG